MIQLKNIIQQLSQNHFEQLTCKLKESKAEKFCSLLEHYRFNSQSDEEIVEQLGLNNNAFYVLKSRLFDKVQHFLVHELTDTKTDTLLQLTTIPDLVFNTPGELSVAVLTKLEKQLQKMDMPYHLTLVYSALKKLSLNTPKYYEYSQRYNKHVAFSLALDKAEDLLADFCKRAGEYHLSRDRQALQILALIKKEMNNLCELYDSHHLKICKYIVDISAALFASMTEYTKQDEPVEDMLDKMSSILSAHPAQAHTLERDRRYRYLINVFSFLSYVYYHNHKLYKKELQYFEIVNNNFPSFLNYNHSCMPSFFFISKIETTLLRNTEASLYTENKKLFEGYQPDPYNLPGRVNYFKYTAVSAYYSGKYKEAAKLLGALLNETGFKDFPHAETELRLLLALLYAHCHEFELAWQLVRNTTRKVSQLNEDGSYENAVTFSRLLKLLLSTPKKETAQKLLELKNRFLMYNQGDKHMLEFISFDEKFVERSMTIFSV